VGVKTPSRVAPQERFYPVPAEITVGQVFLFIVPMKKFLERRQNYV